MRHAFAFPIHIRDAVRAHVRQAVNAVDPAHYRQEPAYIAALLARLEGVAYDGSDGSVLLKATNVNSIGRDAAEKWSGADFAITADIRKDNLSVIKAILAQGKLGSLEDIGPSERTRLTEQIRKMLELTRSPKVLVIGEFDGRREPEVASGRLIASELPTAPLSLPDYFVRRILTTLDGDTRPSFVAGVQDSSLKQLQVAVRVLSTRRLRPGNNL